MSVLNVKVGDPIYILHNGFGRPYGLVYDKVKSISPKRGDILTVEGVRLNSGGHSIGSSGANYSIAYESTPDIVLRFKKDRSKRLIKRKLNLLATRCTDIDDLDSLEAMHKCLREAIEVADNA